MLTIQIDKRQLAELRASMGAMADKLPKAMSRAINRTAKPTGIKLLADEVGKEITMKKSSIKRRFRLARRATPQELTATIAVNRLGKQLPNVKSFANVRKSKGHVRVRFRRGEKIERIRGWLVRGRGNQEVGVSRYEAGSRRFYRGPRGGRYRSLTGPSVVGVLQGEPGLADRALADIGRVLECNAANQVEWELVRTAKR